MGDKKLFKFVTFNCKNIKRSIEAIHDLCKTADLIALQETWLLPNELSMLNSISDDFGCTGVSAVDTTAGMLRGRPHGGVALLWKRSVFQEVSVVQCHNSRICAAKVVLNDKAFLVFSVCLYAIGCSGKPNGIHGCT
jgi:hypothetical protein